MTCLRIADGSQWGEKHHGRITEVLELVQICGPISYRCLWFRAEFDHEEFPTKVSQLCI
jgi:hypothetical protein